MHTYRKKNMAKKFSLIANPTFKVKVAIPVAGSKSVDIEMTFKHRTREDFKKFIEELPGREDLDVMLDVACGWDLDEPFSEENIELLTQNHAGSANAIAQAYINELTGARTKN